MEFGRAQIVRSLKGHDRGRLFCVMDVEDGAVLLDMGGAEPVRFEKAEVALVRLRVEF